MHEVEEGKRKSWEIYVSKICDVCVTIFSDRHCGFNMNHELWNLNWVWFRLRCRHPTQGWGRSDCWAQNKIACMHSEPVAMGWVYYLYLSYELYGFSGHHWFILPFVWLFGKFKGKCIQKKFKKNSRKREKIGNLNKKIDLKLINIDIDYFNVI